MHCTQLKRICATRAEAWAAGRVAKEIVGIGCFNNENPQGELMSWGVCGSTIHELDFAEAVEGISLVDINGEELWHRDPDAIPTGLPEVVVHTPEEIVDHPKERAWIYTRTHAHILDLESLKLARTGRLRRIVRVVSDGPGSLLHLAAYFALRDGSIDLRMIGCATRMAPFTTSAQVAKLSRAILSLANIRFY